MINLIYKLYRFLSWQIGRRWNEFRMNAVKLGFRGKHVILGTPSTIVGSQQVFLETYTRLQGHHVILCSEGKFIMKKYSGASIGLTVVTGNHIPVVGIPHYVLAPSHVRDIEKDVIVDEDVWIGTNVTLLSGSHIGRGAVLGARTLIPSNATVPPYAVVVGCPFRIVGVKFSIDQILKHEEKLYFPEERFTRPQLEQLFDQYYKEKKVLGIDNDLSDVENEILEATMKTLGFRYPRV